MEYNNAWIKAVLLSGRTVGFFDRANKYAWKMDLDNHHRDSFLFVRLNKDSRVRLVIDDNPRFMIDAYSDTVSIFDAENNQMVVENVAVEEAAIHAPEQLFLGLYEYCKIGCRFCPFGTARVESDIEKVHYSLDSIFRDIDSATNKNYTSIGITTAIPFNLSSDDVADELIFTVRKIREKVGSTIPIGVSTRIPSIDKLRQLYESGANEVRLNIEVADEKLAVKLMPNKPQNDIMISLTSAVDVFGRGKVSSNIVVGLGETDSQIVTMVERLAQIGVVATLYPYDPIDCTSVISRTFSRPSADRLYALAVEHKRILDSNGLDPTALLTMCPACAASHILPGKDL